MRVLIVDDEYSARQMLLSLVDWKEAQCEPPLLAGNGQEASLLCESNEFDLIFTDIEMPIMNGLDFIAQQKEKDNAAQFVIISCHESFEYAKQAMKYGIQEYILKDLATRAELMAILSNALQKKQNRQKPLLQTGKACFAIAVDDYYNDYDTSWLNLIKNNIEHQSSAVRDNILLLTLPVAHSRSACQGIQSAVATANRVRETANALGLKNVSIGIGEDFVNEEQAILALKSRVYSGMNKNLIYSANCEDMVIDVDKVENMILTVKQLAINEDAECIKYIDRLFSMNGLSGFEKVYYYDYLLMKLCSHAFHIASRLDKTFFSFDRAALQNEEAIKAAVKKMYYELLDLNSKKNIRPIIAQTIELIEQCYKTDVSLNNLAEKLFTHKGYLCRAFKEDMGENIMQYIINRKVAEAKKLLKSNRYKLFEISDSLGFATPQYFSYVFKKTVGCTPNEYKKSNR